MIKKLWLWFLRKASIKKKLIISFSILVLIPIILLGGYAYTQSKENMEEQIMNTMQNNVNRLLMEMESRFQRETDFTKYLAYNLNFRKTIEYNPYNHVILAQVLNNSVEPILWYFLTSDTYMKEISIYTPFVTQQVGSFLKPDQECREERWYQLHQNNFKTIWSYEDGRLFATRSLLNTATSSKCIGVMRTEFFMSSLMEPLESINYLDNGILIKDNKNQIIYQRKTQNEAVNEAVLRQVLNDDSKQNNKAEPYLLLEGTIDICEWKLYYYIDSHNITKQLYPILYSTLWMVVICLLVVIIFIGFLSKTLSNRILNLKLQAEQISQGILDAPIHTEDTDEIGIVTNSLGDMTNRLNEMITQVYKIRLEKNAAELKALQAMINPHFLYNSLSNIKWRALKKGDDDISEITGLLAKFYRTSLNNGNQITTVQNELENIKAYVQLQRMTHEYSFDVEYIIEEAALEFSMLNFVLQPIVENAIKHGMDYQEGDGEKGLIMVECYQEGEYLLFHVINNGPQLECETLDEVLNKPSKGYGILNIQQRIALNYGEGSRLSAMVTPQGYTCFTVKIKKQVS